MSVCHSCLRASHCSWSCLSSLVVSHSCLCAAHSYLRATHTCLSVSLAASVISVISVPLTAHGAVSLSSGCLPV
ncbi:hypothetical protein FKM82_010028 [Ascaphus truei]